MIERYILRTYLTITENEFMKSGKPKQTTTIPYQVITITFLFFLCITYTKLDVDGNEILGNKKCQRIQIYRDNIIIIQGKKQSLCYPDNTLLFD